MSEENAIKLIKQAEAKFSGREQLDNFRQEVALNFAPWLASFTEELILGEDFMAHLIDSTPALLARDYISQIGAMLRPPGKQYFWHRTPHQELNDDVQVRTYLEARSKQMMRIMTDRVTDFAKATKRADEFYGLFGDCVVSVDTDDKGGSLRYLNHHTKDCVWTIGSENKPDSLTRKETMTARVLIQKFKQKIDKLDDKITGAKNKEQTFEIMHAVLPADEYDSYTGKKRREKSGYASVWIDVKHKKIIRETYTKTFRYVIPRSITLPNNPYGISMATTIAIPDARLIQQQALAIMEAAEKQVNPPIIAQDGDAIRGDVGLGAGGITWVDRTYDERQGQPVIPLEMGKNFQLGIDSLLRTEQQLTRAFYLDVLRMPDTRNSKSTVEVQFKIDEYVRAALPLFAPMQAEYNDALLYETDNIIEQFGGYNDLQKPDILEDVELIFQWDNPLSDMMERQKAQLVSEVSDLGQTIAALEAAAAQAPALQQISTKKMFRESVMGIGAASWVLDEKEAEKNEEAASQTAQTDKMIEAAPNVASIVDSGVNAAQAASEIPAQAEPGFAVLPPPA
jgi:hypothetical protein